MLSLFAHLVQVLHKGIDLGVLKASERPRKQRLSRQSAQLGRTQGDLVLLFLTLQCIASTFTSSTSCHAHQQAFKPVHSLCCIHGKESGLSLLASGVTGPKPRDQSKWPKEVVEKAHVTEQQNCPCDWREHCVFSAPCD